MEGVLVRATACMYLLRFRHGENLDPEQEGHFCRRETLLRGKQSVLECIMKDNEIILDRDWIRILVA
jgi:hypothetical protein